MAEPSAQTRELSRFVIDYVRSLGACAAGISTTETLAGGPPSTDLEYVLEGARSAVTFALPLDQEKILKYLGKEDQSAHQADNLRTTAASTGIAQGLRRPPESAGHSLLRRQCEPGISRRGPWRDARFQARHLASLSGRAFGRRLVRLLGQSDHRRVRRQCAAGHDSHDGGTRTDRSSTHRGSLLR